PDTPKAEAPKTEIPKAEPPFPVALLGTAESTPPARRGAEYISLAEVKDLQASPTPPVIVDARSERSYNDSDEWIPGSVRVDPERSVRAASEQHLPKNVTLAVLCA
ncbi:MAG TPA: hypothetical protein VGE93_25695, partial [Bryobacteraceae bacterium]